MATRAELAALDEALVRIAAAPNQSTCSIMEELMNVFGPWLPWLFGVGTVLLVGGLLTKELASDSSMQGLGRGVASAGWRMMLFAAAIYLLIEGLGAVFNSFISNLPGT